MQDFTFSRIPKLHFGPGQLHKLPSLITGKYRRILLVTGSKFFRSSKSWDTLIKSLREKTIRVFDYAISGEPSPGQVDRAVSEFSRKEIDLVIAVGGGSVMDAGKAISAMLPLQSSVREYLEGVGTQLHPGHKIPFMAIPTTAGTGSEATKNAVISEVGTEGFKKSLRHDNFVPDMAMIDPELMISCPFEITASCGLDAYTQLLESYVSTEASPMTDALALSGLEFISQPLTQLAASNDKINLQAWSKMAYAAWISGITLANAGLGVVHGLASPVGGYFEIPHGMFCGTMIAAATEMNIERLNALKDDSMAMALEKYAKVGYLTAGRKFDSIKEGCQLLIDRLYELTDQLNLPPLKNFGIDESNLKKIIDAAGNKNNPVKLAKDEIKKLLEKRL